LKKKKQPVKPIAAHVSIDAWDGLTVQAIREGRKIGEVLDDAIRLYLKKKKSYPFGIDFGQLLD
jgi:hypothetical protein